ncbi:imidazole glycerol phosphate synthase subunit HisH [soil metagenome]
MKTSIPTNNNNNKHRRHIDEAALTSSNPEVAIFDYGAGNLFSLKAALERNGAGNVSIIHDMNSLDKFDGLILPGVGNFDPAIRSVRQDKQLLATAIENKKPVLGICLGMEMLFNSSQEGTLEGLKILDGQVRMLDKKKVKVPHMGWNNIQIVNHKMNISNNRTKRIIGTDTSNSNRGSSSTSNKRKNANYKNGTGSRLLRGVQDNSWVYFVHSYRILPRNTEIVFANAKYGDNEIPAVIEKGNIFGTQFHPEKSGKIGSQIIMNFLKSCSRTPIVEDK